MNTKRKERKNKHLTLVRCSITSGYTWWEEEGGKLWKFPYCSGSYFCKQGGVITPPVSMSIIPEMLGYIAEREINNIF